MMRKKTGLMICGLVVAAVTALAACSSSRSGSSGGSGGSSGGSSSGGPVLHNVTLPAKIKSAGQVDIATDPTYPPFETLSTDQKTIVGLDPDLMTVLGAKLGLKAHFVQAGFDSIIPGLQAGRYDMAMSAMTDTKQREQEVIFVDYIRAGGAVLMNASDPMRTQAPGTEWMCGKTVGMQTGTTTLALSVIASKQCTADKKPPIHLSSFPSVPAALLALSSGRIHYVWTDSISGGTEVKQSHGAFTFVSDGSKPLPTGIAFPKGATALADAFKRALQASIDDGSYQKVLAQFGLQQAAVPAATLNGAAD